LGSQEGSEVFSYYPDATILSGRFADQTEDRETVRRYLLAREKGSNGETLSEADLNEILNRRLETKEFRCATKTISQVIRETGVDRIDLLKVDVEKAELDVLLGIEENDWPLIQRVIVEVHDIDNRAEQVRRMLDSAGFHVALQQDALLQTTNIYTVYGTRKSGVKTELRSPALPMWASSAKLSRELIDFTARSLPSYMVPAQVVFLDELPLTPNGKVDRNKLPKPRNGTSPVSRAPRTKLELGVAEIWCEVLKIESVGAQEDFFELGGHSLLATRVAARIRDRFGIEFPLRHLFDCPTVEGVALALIKTMLERERRQGAGA
jgi:FkbM family methyltransferase